MHERERPMLHDNNAFKSRPQSGKILSNISSSKNKINEMKKSFNHKKVDLKTLFNTTVTQPFHHKNFSEIPD